jgi:putative ABC transport system permease protein
MRPSTLVALAIRSILRNRMRSLLTVLGIVIGVGAVIVMIALGYGARSTIQAQVANLGTNMIVITPGSAAEGAVRLGAGTGAALTVADAETLARETTFLAAVSPDIFAPPMQVVVGAVNWRTRVQGVAPAYRVIRDWPLAAGEFFEDEDVRGVRRVAVLGTTVAEALFPGTDPVGRELRLGPVPFMVAGVLAPKGQTAVGADQDDVILVPYTTHQVRLSGRTFVGQILASTYSPADIPAAQDEARAILRDAHRLGPGEPDDFTIRDQTDLAQAAQATTQVMTWLLAAIASISLLVGGIGIMNIMLVSVTERTREIGIRLAIGARGSDVLTQFLVESVVMSTVGGLLGLVAGIAGSTLVGWITGWSMATPPEAVLVAVGFSAAVGIFFGLYPARKAAALDPIEALRRE